MKEIPLIYLWIHFKLQQTRLNYLHKRQISEIIRRNIRLPKRRMDINIIKELEKFGLIQKINKRKGYLISSKKYVVEDLLD